MFLKIWHIRVNYCWHYGPSNSLFCFFRCRLGQFNNRQIKIAENWTIHFYTLTSKQVFGESFKFFDPLTTKWRSFNFFAKLNRNHILMAYFSKLRKYQTFGFIELHNLSKGHFFKLWKISVYDYRAVKQTTFEILTFKFFQFSNNFCQTFYEKTSRFQNIF